MTYDAIRKIQAEEDRIFDALLGDAIENTCRKCNFRRSGECSREVPGFSNDNPCLMQHVWAIQHVMES